MVLGKYTPIEYIETSTGTEYIDTGIYADNYTSLYIKGSFTATSQSTALGIGADLWTDHTLGCNYNKQQNNLYSFLQSDYLIVSVNLAANTPYELEVRSTGTNATSYVNNSQKSTKAISPFTTTGTVRTTIEYAGTRIYAIKITKNSIPIRDMIPVRVGQVGCMYDKVSGKFFANQGSGSFTLGPDV